jgi:hypothetical protein
VISVPEVGNVSISVPRTSVLLLNQAGSHLKRAVRLRSKLPGQTRVPRWTQPGIDRYLPNEDLVFDFFEEAMAGIVLAHTALDNYANECIPADFAYTDDGRRTLQRVEVERRGIQLRLSRIVAAATGRPNLRESNSNLWDRVEELKALRDDISHARWEVGFSHESPELTIYARLIGDPNLLRHQETVAEVMAHYTG